MTFGEFIEIMKLVFEAVVAFFGTFFKKDEGTETEG